MENTFEPQVPGEVPTIGWQVIDYLEAGGPIQFDGFDASGQPVACPGYRLTDARRLALLEMFRVDR